MPTLPRRSDHVGSLLRPRHLAEARQRWRDGELPAGELTTIEDDAIRHVVEQQQRVGLAAITDGEFRRDWWHLDFLAGFDGIELGERPRPVGLLRRPAPTRRSRSSPARSAIDRPIFVDAFAYLAATSTRSPTPDRRDGQDHDPRPGDGLPPGRPGRDRRCRLSRPRRVLVRPRRRLPRRDRRPLRRRVPLPADRRRQLRLPVRRRLPQRRDGARRRSRRHDPQAVATR